jgi:hypothetical protein
MNSWIQWQTLALVAAASSAAALAGAQAQGAELAEAFALLARPS